MSSAVVGHLFSGTTLAAAPVYNGGDDPVAAISPSSSSPEVSSAGDHTFRVCPSDLAHGAALAEWVRETLNLERGAVLYLNDQYGRGIRQTFVEHFTRLGGRLESVDPYLGDRPDVGTLPRSHGAEQEHPVSRGGRQPRRGGGSASPGETAGHHRPHPRRRWARGDRGGRCAGGRRLSHLGLLPDHPHRCQPEVRRGLPPQVSRAPACRTSRRRRPTMPSIS